MKEGASLHVRLVLAGDGSPLRDTHMNESHQEALGSGTLKAIVAGAGRGSSGQSGPGGQGEHEKQRGEAPGACIMRPLETTRTWPRCAG